jgi:hypothetical protein
VGVAALDPSLEDAIRRYHGAIERLYVILLGLEDLDARRAPPGGGWSIAQCVDHLVVAGTKMVAKLEEAITRSRQLTRLARSSKPAKFGWFDRLFIWAVSSGKAGEPPRLRVRHAPPFEPGPGRTVTIVASEFGALQDRLIASARAAQGLDLAGIKVESVISDSIKVSLGAWYLAIAGHQERHLDQAARTRQAIGR